MLTVLMKKCCTCRNGKSTRVVQSKMDRISNGRSHRCNLLRCRCPISNPSGRTGDETHSGSQTNTNNSGIIPKTACGCSAALRPYIVRPSCTWAQCVCAHASRTNGLWSCRRHRSGVGGGGDGGGACATARGLWPPPPTPWPNHVRTRGNPLNLIVVSLRG